MPDDTKRPPEEPDKRIPHDASYKSIFSHPVTVKDLLIGFIHEKWVEDLDCSSLRRLSPNFTTSDLKNYAGDLLWEARLKDQKVYVLLMFEFQSRVDRWMAVRIMNYTALLYQDLLKTKKKSLVDRRLPVVFPIVIYNGKRRWTAPCNISELIHPAPEGFEQCRPSICFFVLDQGRMNLAELPTRNLVAAMIRLGRDPDAEALQAITQDLLSLKGPQYESVLQAFNAWIQHSMRKRLGPGESIPELLDLEEVDAMLSEGLIPWTVEARQKGREEGRREGREEGRQEGRQEGRREGISYTRNLVRRILTRRFGPAPEWLEQRLAGADIPQLEIWADRLLDAPTIEDVFQDG